METPDLRVSKIYNSVFFIHSAKLLSLYKDVEKNFKFIGPNFFRRFEIKTSNDKFFSTSALEQILEHDNAVKNPIVKLEMTFSDNDKKPTNFCKIWFNTNDPKIEVRIEGESKKWMDNLFADVEDQIARSLEDSWVYNVKPQKSMRAIVAMLIPLFLVFFSLLFHPSAGQEHVVTTNFLTPADVNALQQLAVGAEKQEDKVNFNYQLLTRQLSNSHQRQEVSDIKQLSRFGDYLTFKSAFLVLPAVVTICSLFYLLKYCYPWSRFLWGDMLEDYNTLVERRKVIWNTILIALLVSILGNFFMMGLSRFI